MSLKLNVWDFIKSEDHIKLLEGQKKIKFILKPCYYYFTHSAGVSGTSNIIIMCAGHSHTSGFMPEVLKN